MKSPALTPIVHAALLAIAACGVQIAHAQTADTAVLAPVTVSDSADPARPYAGGQVSRGGGLGLLGDRDTLDTPFSQRSYTAGYAQDQQARTFGEVLEANPSVRRSGGRFNANDSFVIRGFSVNGYDIAYDGMYGLTNVRRNAIEGVERIDLLKGPNALLNGVPPSGAIGGSVNLVPKRAGAQPVSEVTVGFTEKNNLGTHLDVGRRFGEGQQFGARVNVAHREGDTPFRYNSERQSNAHLALDWLRDSTRLYATVNYEKFDFAAPVFSGLTLPTGVPVPRAPVGETNPNPPWTRTYTERNYGTLRGEVDLSPDWTVAAGYGWQEVNELQYVAYGQVIRNAAADLTEPNTYRLTVGERHYRTADARISGRLRTGPISHQVSLGYNRVQQDWDFAQQLITRANPAVSNLYDLRVNYAQPSFAGVAVSRSPSRLELDGLAVSDTLSAFDDQVQLVLGVRRQGIKRVDLSSGAVQYDRHATTPAVALTYKPARGWAVYGNYIEALTQAPTPPTTAANPNDVFAPARSKQKELGVKWDGGSTGATAAVFDITQPSGITDPVTRRFSVDGSQRHRGVELETFGEPVAGVRLLGGLTFIDAKLLRTQGAVNQGKQAPGVPEWAASLGGEWDLPFVPGLTLTARSVFNGRQYLDAANTQQFPSWTRLDLGARYATKVQGHAVTVRAGVSNVANRAYWENGFSIGAPRTVSLSTTVAF